MNDILFRKVRQALERSWSAESSFCFSPDAYPSYGQCAQTSIVVQEIFGGAILRTIGWHGGNHFYNHINGKRIDFTSDQFTMPSYYYALTYEDWPSNATEASKETLPSQINALKLAFRRAIDEAA